MIRSLSKYAILVLIIFVMVVFLNRYFSANQSVATGGGISTPKSTQCLAISQDVNQGAFLDQKSLEWHDCRQLSDVAGADDYFWRDNINSASLIGAVTRVRKAKGDLLMNREVILPGESDFLSAVLKPGTRAVAIRVDDVTGGAGLIRPGNLVDVIVSGKFNHESSGFSEVATAKTLLNGVRVLAVNRDIVLQDQGSKSDSSNSRLITRDNKGTITLEVAPKEVELLTVARTMGTLSLSLCALEDDNGTVATVAAGPTLASEIVRPKGTTAKDPAPKSVVTMYGSDKRQQLNR